MKRFLVRLGMPKVRNNSLGSPTLSHSQLASVPARYGPRLPSAAVSARQPAPLPAPPRATWQSSKTWRSISRPCAVKMRPSSGSSSRSSGSSQPHRSRASTPPSHPHRRSPHIATSDAQPRRPCFGEAARTGRRGLPRRLAASPAAAGGGLPQQARLVPHRSRRRWWTSWTASAYRAAVERCMCPRVPHPSTRRNGHGRRR